MNRPFWIALVCCLTGTPALAWTYIDTSNLANIIASEGACGLTFSQEGISAWVITNVPADEAAFPNDLQTAMYGTERDIEDMGASQLTAHCAQVRRLAARVRTH